MEEIFSNLYLTTYFLGYVGLFVFYKTKQREKILQLSSTSFSLAYLAITAFLSIIYYDMSNEVFRDYSNITAEPLIYLFFSFSFVLLPIYFHDCKYYSNKKKYSFDKYTLLNSMSLLIILCTLLPFAESIIKLPQALSSSNAANLYDQQLLSSNKNVEYLSFFGRKFFLIIWRLSNIIPVLIFVQYIRGRKRQALILCLSLMTIWIHSMSLGGRSKLVQNALYLVFSFMVFKNFFHDKDKKDIIKYGLAVISVAVLSVTVVTISRFAAKDVTAMTSIWEWVGLYAGEGTLNFDTIQWYVKNTLGGAVTFKIFVFLFTGEQVSVDQSWALGDSLGKPGNIFYTFISNFYDDFGRWGGFFFFVGMSLFVIIVYKYIAKNLLSRLTIICLWGKILMVGPIFFTYSTLDDQWNLVISILFVVYVAMVKT